jgi:hypothetical protein
METFLNRPVEHHPIFLFAVALVAQWLAACLGDVLKRRGAAIDVSERDDLHDILAATMSLLALIIGFTFAMAISRYNERNDLEDAEAAALTAEYARADLLPTSAAAKVRDLLARYAEQRVLFYQVDDPERLEQVRADTARLGAELWSAVTGPAAATPTPITALVVSGMNDVLNSATHTEAAWRFHIPAEAWLLMLLIAMAGNLLLGLSEKSRRAATLVILPVIISIPFFLIADIDSPRAGIIRVVPVNLIAQAQSLRAKAP